RRGALAGVVECPGVGEPQYRLARQDRAELVEDRHALAGGVESLGRTTCRQENRGVRSQRASAHRRERRQRVDGALRFALRRLEVTAHSQDLGEIATRDAVDTPV